MKIAVTGKGGVGKTTVAAILARLYADEGRSVVAADVDPDANLGLALGFTDAELASITPISAMKDLINERTGADSSGLGKFFKINPKVDDIPDRFALNRNGVKLLVLGTVDTGGSGCVCPEHVLLKRLLSHLVLREDDVVIMDMEAGLEHLGRGTTSFMDRFIVVIEPGARSVQTYNNVRRLALDLGITRVDVIANKVRDADDEAFVRASIPELLGVIRYSDAVIDADRQGKSPFDLDSAVVDELRKIKAKIDAGG
ncbi:MAG: AAA family ATPase [Oscillospiraceae bacterium]|jgi:CO dehydrogenase maturation factor|nr:AAA family ATPase [Oscillospiraceae bacterium]